MFQKFHIKYCWVKLTSVPDDEGEIKFCHSRSKVHKPLALLLFPCYFETPQDYEWMTKVVLGYDWMMHYLNKRKDGVCNNMGSRFVLLFYPNFAQLYK